MDNHDHIDADMARRCGMIAIAFLLLLALLSALGSFVIWIAGGFAAYFAFLAFYYLPRPQISNPFSSNYESSNPDQVSPEYIQEKIKKGFQIGTAALVVIFIILFVIGSMDGNKTTNVSSSQAGKENAVLLKADPDNIDALTSIGNKFYSDNIFDSAMFYYYDQKQYLNSIEVLRTCLQIDGSNKDAAYVMGHNYFDQEQYDEAFNWYSKAYDAGLRDAFLSHALGYLYDEKKQNTSRAIGLYKEALNMDSSRTNIYARLAELEPEKATFYKRKEKGWTK